MAEFKIVISDPKTGKSAQKEVKDEQASGLIGLKIGDKFKGELLDLTGYEFEITGGSDYCGFPMRKDVKGSARKMILAVSGVGISNKRKYRSKKKKGLRTMKGMRTRKTVAGSTIYDRTAQINLKILKQGKADLFAEAKPEAPKEGEKPAEGKAPEAEAKKEAPKAEEKSKEAPKEKSKEKKSAEKKQEKKPEEKKAQKPEEKKEEPKKEEKPAEKKE